MQYPGQHNLPAQNRYSQHPYHSMPSASSVPRKRPAPGAIPTPHSVHSTTPMPTPTSPTTQGVRWENNNLGSSMENTAVNDYDMMSSPAVTPVPPQAQFPQAATPFSSLSRPTVRGHGLTTVATRPHNNQLVPTPRVLDMHGLEGSWGAMHGDIMLAHTNSSTMVEDHENLEVLEDRAQMAKREAQVKRKQIPPFVQKLNSFLEESKNTELIRWSEKGDSFVVLDEDEFARTLIPELFKHNNYASFVRQLNMYGFHKKVGLSDNSMKASERKNKSPSEYFNPFFRRGHPNLLWLINKSKSAQASIRLRNPELNPDSDDDSRPMSTSVSTGAGMGLAFADKCSAGKCGGLPGGVATTSVLPPLDSGCPHMKEVLALRRDVCKLQHSNQHVREALQRLQQTQLQMHNRGALVQEQCARQEASLNAVVGFLSTVFRKPIEDGVIQNDFINEVFAGTFSPHVHPVQQRGHQEAGTVEDLGDLVQRQLSASSASTPVSKRVQHLLPPVPRQGQGHPQSASTTAAAPDSFASHTHHTQIGTVTELYDVPTSAADTSTLHLHQERDGGRDGMMKLIHETNANAAAAASATDFTTLPTRSTSNLTGQQGEGMLSTASGGGHSRMSPTPPAEMSSSLLPAVSEALPSLLPPALSPAGAHMQQHTTQGRDCLDMFQQMRNVHAQNISDVDQGVHQVASQSPSAHLPESDAIGGHFDNFDEYIDTDPYNFEASLGIVDGMDFPDPGTNLDGSHLEPFSGSAGFIAAFDVDVNGNDHAETTSTANNSPSNATSGTDEILRDVDDGENSNRPAKRQRTT